MGRALISIILWLIISLVVSFILAPYIPERIFLILATMVLTYLIVKKLMRLMFGVRNRRNY